VKEKRTQRKKKEEKRNTWIECPIRPLYPLEMTDAQVPGEGEVTSSTNWTQQPPYASKYGASFSPKYSGSCFCGKVRFSACEDPVDVKICHCRSCQSLHGAPMQWAAIFHKHHVLFAEESLKELEFYNSTLLEKVKELPCKVSCKRCNSPIADEGRNMLMMFPSAFKFVGGETPPKFKPTCHIFYSQRVLKIRDGLPKFQGHKNQSDQLPDD